jgi:hypothetical protein
VKCGFLLEGKSIHLKCLKQRALEQISVGEKNFGIECIISEELCNLSSSCIIKVVKVMMVWIVSSDGER